MRLGTFHSWSALNWSAFTVDSIIIIEVNLQTYSGWDKKKFVSLGIISFSVTVNEIMGVYSNIHLKANIPSSERKLHDARIRNFKRQSWRLKFCLSTDNLEIFCLHWVLFFLTSPWDELTVINIFGDATFIIKHSITPQTNTKKRDTKHHVSFTMKRKPACHPQGRTCRVVEWRRSHRCSWAPR